MISYWHLSAVCCIPLPNPKARLREREIFRLVPHPARGRGKRSAERREPETPSLC